MSDNKRKLDEFCDPDYQEFHQNKKRKVSPQKMFTGNERIEKIKSIVKREFQNELLQKEHEINKIESRLLQVNKKYINIKIYLIINSKKYYKLN